MKLQSLSKVIGNTPIIKINFNLKATILAKLEYLNPGVV